eukprot:173292_1
MSSEDHLSIWLKLRIKLNNVNDQVLENHQDDIINSLGGIRSILQDYLINVDVLKQFDPQKSKSLLNTLYKIEEKERINKHPPISDLVVNVSDDESDDDDESNDESLICDTNLISLPTDLLSSCCQYLTICDLKSVQLTCSALTPIARLPSSTNIAVKQLLVFNDNIKESILCIA